LEASPLGSLIAACPRIEEKRRRRSDVQWQIVPDMSSGDRESLIANGGESSSADNQ